MKERAEKLAEFPFLIGKVLTGMTILLSTVGIKFPFLIGKVLTIDVPVMFDPEESETSEFPFLIGKVLTLNRTLLPMNF